MPIFIKNPPLSLYIHIPWCVRKCPYCDFNSHEAKGALPEMHYVAVLLKNLDHYLPLIQSRSLVSIFLGGGTPSLFSGKAISTLLQGIADRIPLQSDIEITLEANPGTIDQTHFYDFRMAGINRLSLGIQSLQDDKLHALGRIHDTHSALNALNLAKAADFHNINIDLMYGLPNQSISDALHDLRLALSFSPTHLSWYQLTIEPNTLFYKQRPLLPADDSLWEMQIAGQDLLKTAGFEQYEISAYAQPQQACIHNRNYWEFGDYLGIGAGAHSKITQIESSMIMRFVQAKHPKDYLAFAERLPPEIKRIDEKDRVLEFMLNALRLTQGFPLTLFNERTGLPIESISHLLSAAQTRGLLESHPTHIRPSALGIKFLNDLTAMFLDD